MAKYLHKTKINAGIKATEGEVIIKDQPAPWTKKEIAILSNGQPPRHQAALLPGRTMAAIRWKRSELGLTRQRGNPADKVEQPTPADAYDGRPVRPYQFIRTADATPARKKVWAKEERAMQTV